MLETVWLTVRKAPKSRIAIIELIWRITKLPHTNCMFSHSARYKQCIVLCLNYKHICANRTAHTEKLFPDN